MLSRKAVQPLIDRALREDEAARDITSTTLLRTPVRIRARIIAKASGILAGVDVARWVFLTQNPSIRCVIRRRDGAHVTRGQPILTLAGSATSILAAERTALNVLGHLSGIATLTRAFVSKIHGTHATILDTRKTLPGLRALEKYAVRVGGGVNHRGNLAEAILIKTNHLRVLGQGAGDRGRGKSKTIIEAIVKATGIKPKRFVGIEVTNLSECKAALAARPDAILLDNWRIGQLRRAVVLSRPTPPRPAGLDRRGGHAPCPLPLLEVSGGVTLSNVRAIATTGVDRISVGRLTHSAPALDVALTVV